MWLIFTSKNKYTQEHGVIQIPTLSLQLFLLMPQKATFTLVSIGSLAQTNGRDTCWT